MFAAPLEKIVHGLRRSAEAGFLADSDDTELLRRFQKERDAAAFEALVRRHGSLVLAACRKVLGDEADVEDVFQATFLTLLRKAQHIRKRQSVGPWLFGVAHRLAVRARSAAERRKARERESVKRREPPDLSWREACAALHEELDKLPDRLRMPLLLCYLDGKSRDEAARQLGCTLNTVKKRLELGRGKLRARMTRRGLALSAGLLATVADSAAANGLSPKLLEVTVQAATTGKYSPAVAGLLRGVSPTMLPRTLKVTAMLIIALGALASASGQRPAAPAAPPTEGAKPQAAEATMAFTGRIASLENQSLKGITVEIVRVGQPAEGDLTAWLNKNVSLRKEHYWLNENGLSMTPGASAFKNAKTTTDAEGKFTFADVPRDRVLAVRVHGPAVETKFFWIVTRPGGPKDGYIKTAEFNHGVYGPDVTVLLAPSRPLVGTVRDAKTGKPVAGVVVTEANSNICTTTTDAEGKYRLEGVRKKPGYSICVAGRKGLPYFDHTDRGARDTAGLGPMTIDVTVDRGVELTGRVVDKQGRPVARAEVFYDAAGDNPNAKANNFRVITSDGWKTKADGTFYLTVWPGKGVLQVHAGDRYSTVEIDRFLDQMKIKSRLTSAVNALIPIDVDETKPESLNINIALDDAARRPGTVVGPDGQPLSGVTAAGLKSGPLTPLPGAEFAVTGMHANSKRMLVFMHEEKKLGAVTTIAGGGNEPIKVELQALGSMTGVVQNAGKQPWSGLTVTALPWARNPNEFHNLPMEAFQYQGTTGLIGAPWWKLTKRTAKTDADGRFRLDDLVPGLEYTIYVTDGEMAKRNTAVVSRGKIEVQSGKVNDLGILISDRK